VTTIKHFLKRCARACGFSIHRLPPGIVTGGDLGRDLRLVLGDTPGLVCVDVGANHGSTIELLRTVLREPTIHAFEPNPAAFEVLKKRYGGSPQTSLVNVGVGDTKGTLTLNAVANHTLNSFLPLTTNGRASFGVHDAPHPIHVPVLVLADYAAEHRLSTIDLLKIDTQGFELHVLRGCEVLLAKRQIQNVLVELNFAELYAGQANAADVIAFLQQRGLRLVDLYEKCRHNPVLGWCTALFTRKELSHP
jgi:FkbM family methyltransferase